MEYLSTCLCHLWFLLLVSYNFLCTVSFVSLSKFIPKYLIFVVVVAMVNGIDSLIPLSDFSLLVYSNANNFLCIDFVSYNLAKFTN